MTRCDISHYTKNGAELYSPAPFIQQILLRQFSGDTFGPPLHAVLASKSVFREGIEINLLELFARRNDLIALVIIDRAGEHIKACELTSQHLSQDIAYFLNNSGVKISNTGLKFLTFHEAIQTQRAGLGIEVIPAWNIGASLGLFSDPGIDGSPRPSREQ